MSRWLGRAALVILSLALSSLALDLVSRSIYDRRVLVRPNPIFKNRWPVDPRLYRYDANVSFGRDIVGGLALMSPGSPAVVRYVEFITDANGFRNRPNALLRENALVLVGDSFGVGSSSTQSDTLAAVLERDHGFPTYNLSVGKHGPWHELMTLKYEFDDIPKTRNATILWLLYEGNDLDDPIDSDVKLAPNGWGGQLGVRFESFVNRSPIKQSIRRLRPKYRDRRTSKVVPVAHDGRTMLFWRPALLDLDRPPDEVRDHPNLSAFGAIFDLVTEFARARNHRLLVVLVPTKEQVYRWIADKRPGRSPIGDLSPSAAPSLFAESIRSLAKAKEVEFLDLLPVLEREAQSLYRNTQKYLYWPDDTHWNGEGQRVGAGAIARSLGFP